MLLDVCLLVIKLLLINIIMAHFLWSSNRSTAEEGTTYSFVLLLERMWLLCIFPLYDEKIHI